jgi:hypothetical protein
MAEEIAPPGRARITRCGTCGNTGRLGSGECYDCEGTGWQLWRACPRCGDIGWDRLAPGSYACRISCGSTWGEDDPGWQAQRLPDRLARPAGESGGTATVSMTAVYPGEGFRPFR